jgi:predicted RNA binding protein with dsRBD fold (UPF0201 family)
MIKLELNLDEEDLKSVVKALESYLSDLSMEIADTDSMDFREELKNQRISIQKALEQLKRKETK